MGREQLNARPMVEKAWQWAHKNNCLRKNEIHGEEEALLVLSDSYELLDQEGQELSMGGTIEMEVSCLESVEEKNPKTLNP